MLHASKCFLKNLLPVFPVAFIAECPRSGRSSCSTSLTQPHGRLFFVQEYMELNSDTAIKDDPEIAAPCNDARDGEGAEATPVPGDVNAAAAATDTEEGQAPKSSSGRKRVPTAAALASSEQAQEAAPGKSKTRQRKKAAETSVVSRTSHGGVKIGGRAVTWVGGAGMPREVCSPCQLPMRGFPAHGIIGQASWILLCIALYPPSRFESHRLSA